MEYMKMNANLARGYSMLNWQSKDNGQFEQMFYWHNGRIMVIIRAKENKYFRGNN